MTIVLTVGGAHLRVFLGNNILDDTNMIEKKNRYVLKNIT